MSDSGRNSSVSTQLVTEIEDLERLSEPWRRLAHSCASPAALPGWQLAWWRHLAPEGALLRAVAVFDDGRLVGMAPFFVVPGRVARYRLFGGEMTRRMRPLALPEIESEATREIAAQLARATPRPDLIALEGVDRESRWHDVLAESWPGLPPWRYLTMIHPGPVIDTTQGDFDSWLASRGIRDRKNLRVARRRADEIGARMRLATSEEDCRDALDHYRRLHLARLERRGGSSLDDAAFEMIEDAARTLVPGGEMRVYVLETSGETIAVSLGLAAGGELLLFSSGFDEAFARISPIFLMVLEIVEEAFANGDRRIDFGGGVERHKHVFANADAPVSWGGLAIRSRHYPLTRARLAPERLRWHRYRLAHRFLSQDQIDRLKRPRSRT